MKSIIITSSILILIVVALRYLLKEKISSRLRYTMWLLVAIRLLFPFEMGQSSLSVMTLVERAEQSAAVYEEYEQAGTPQDFVDVTDPAGIPTIIPVTPHDPTEAPIKENNITVIDTLTIIYVTGALSMAVWILFVNLRFRREAKKKAVPLEGTVSPIPVYVSENIPSPCLLGYFHPAIYLTPYCAKEPALTHVLSHELTHWCNHDVLWSAVRGLCLCLHWYNPLVWWAAALSKHDCELACDEGALARLQEEDRLAYGRTLVDMTVVSSAPAFLLQTATTMADRARKNILIPMIVALSALTTLLFGVLLLDVLPSGLFGLIYLLGVWTFDAMMPLLNSIPKQFNKINVTMGYPVTATPLVSFIGGIAALQRDIRVKDGKVSFYHGSIEALLKHEYVKEYAWNDAVAIIRNLVQENLIYLASDSPVFGQMESPLLKLIFKIPENAMELLDYLTDILKQLDLVADTLNKEFIYRYYLAIERLRRVEIPMRKETCIRLLSQITSSITIPFKGEPLAGLQVIGSLEVRALDFENLIILSVNEGRFPKSSQSDSLIPYNLRIGFGLPTYELHDAIAAYHFYRSIYRAKNVWLIYDTRTEGLKSGEVSRFVKQLEYHYNVDIKKSVAATPPLLDTADTPIVVEKSPQVMEKLHELFIGDGGKKSLSASSINTYLACPLQFYLQYVEGFKDEESVEESIEASTFGTIFHDTMEELYSAYQGEIVSEEIIDSIMKGRKRLDEVIGRMFSKSRIQEISGRNIIVKEVIKKYVLITLQEDKKYAPFTYIAGEKTFYHKLELPDGNNVRIKAVIDRIDISSEVLRVIDYKTGGVEVPKKDMPVNEFFVRDSGKHYKAFVQLYLYALILSELSDEKGALALDNGRSARVDFSEDQSNFSVVVYPVTAIKKSSIVCEPVYKGKLEEYKAALMECVAEIFDPQTPFLQACQGSDVCAYCMFRQICGR